MKTSTKTLFAAMAVAALAAAAAPASAQGWDHDHGRADRGDYNINARQAQLNQRIAYGVRDGSLTHREADRLMDESRDIARLEARYRVNGLNGWERADLDRRLDRLDVRISRERHDRDYSYGYRR